MVGEFLLSRLIRVLFSTWTVWYIEFLYFSMKFRQLSRYIAMFCITSSETLKADFPMTQLTYQWVRLFMHCGQFVSNVVYFASHFCYSLIILVDLLVRHAKQHVLIVK